ncbi:MAG: DUF4230 domain-containing protein [Prevotella sp.]|nr:DUF4230 domain-containing protein [Prevotella sp.]
MAKKDRNNWELTVKALTLVAIIIVLWWLLFAEKDNHLGLNTDDAINITPEQIESIKSIGEWEFLSISNEELVDTVRKGFLKDDQLVRIYYGTLRLGTNMSDIKVQAKGDSVLLMLPPIQLLDRDFIDEARTKAIYESGTWSPQDREKLYQKARRQMLAHSLTPQNLQSAQDNADAQLRRMMKALGYNNIIIRFDKR